MNTIKFYSTPPKVVHRIYRQLWKYDLPAILNSMLWYSCDEETPVTVQQNSDETSLNDGNKLLDMTESDLMKYYGVKDVSQFVPGYTYSFIDTLDTEELNRIRSKISVRSSEDCGINVELLIDGPADTARVTVYEANTMTIVHGPVLMVDNDDFNMTISGAKDYDFELEPIDNPTSSTMGNLVVDPDWGGKTIYSFSGPGVDFNEDFHFECPAPEPDGTCFAEVAIEKYAGDAASYYVEFDDGSLNPPGVTVSGIWNDFEPIEIDETKTYDIIITPNPPSGVYEDYRVNIVRPDQISHFYYMYHLGNTTGNINDINYLECPY